VTNVIEIENLHKSYRRRSGTTVAVEGLNLAIPEGGVYGFLGPNGSGKTTTIRCILGLARPTKGELRLLGRPVPSGLREAVLRTGAIVETPALFPTMTARENLRLLASIDGIGRRAVDRVIEEVGLSDRATDLVKTYSLGMKQRLAMAAALLKDPELLILDEPANGLDPAGMREVRQLLRRLADDGRTVFVSSHILAEMESVCDRVAILARGQCVCHGTVNDVISTFGHRSAVVVKVADLEAGQRALREAGMIVEREFDALRVEALPESGADITRVLARADQWVTEMTVDQLSLEDVFLELTSSASDESSAIRPNAAVDQPEEVVA
jgi:ABC-2 type transport system ATP-binding protein